jgi:hypothetical protein
MINKSDGTIRDSKGNIVPDEVISAEIETYGSWGNEKDWDNFNKERALWDNWPWCSYNTDDNITLHIKGGTKIICAERNHNCNIKGLLGGETTAGVIKLRNNGEIKLPNDIIINAPQNTTVSVEYENGECTITIGNSAATLTKTDNSEVTLPAGTIIDNNGNIIK